MRKRTIYDIYADILIFLSVVGNARITRIARFANLPVDRAKNILIKMYSIGLLRKREEKGAIFYYMTRRGYEYLSLYKRLKLLTGFD